MKRIFIIILFLPLVVLAQTGGQSTFEFVSLPYSAKENAFGGTIITSTENDLSFALKNPSLLDSSHTNEIIGNWGLLHMKDAGIGLGTIGFAHAVSNNITLQSGIHFINYGKFSGYDEYGNHTGTFIPAEYQIIIGGAYSITENISTGINVKPILSYMESYSSYGLLFDIGVSYKLDRSCVSLATRNIGCQIKPYTENNREPVPYSIDLGYSAKLEHAPIRFSVCYEDLQKFNISVEEKKNSTNSAIYNEQEERALVSFGSNFMKHITLSAELLIGKHIVIMGGYNYRKANELSFGAAKYGAGISAGLALNFSRFNISYGWAKQQAAGSRNFFTLGFNSETLYSVCKTGIQKHIDSKL